jgi:hypothetical protein
VASTSVTSFRPCARVPVGVVLDEDQDTLFAETEDSDLFAEVAGERAGCFADAGATARGDGGSSTPIECVDRSCPRVVCVHEH